MNSIRQSTIRFRLFVLLTVTIATVSFWVVQSVVSAQARTPFTAVVRQTVYELPSGEVYAKDQGFFAVRGDGSFANVRSLASPNGRSTAVQKQVTDLDRAEQISTDELTESVSTTPLQGDAIDHHRKLKVCEPEDRAERGELLGYEVFQKVTDHYGPGQMVRTEEWIAPSLNCYVLERTVSRGASEAALRTSIVSEALQITEGEPAAWIFERPDGYVERSPSQRKAEFEARFPEVAARNCASCLNESYGRADEAYDARRNAAQQ